MGLSKSKRMIILLIIDTCFFFLELIIGISVHSLALVADSFHMLNDVISLLIGFWAVKAASSKRSEVYTYGLQRAETLGALVNGVFLIALCLSIFLEAIQRFFDPQVITNPVLIGVVGFCGLVSNIIGLFLFHGHSHGHGGHGHDHGDTDELSSAENGHSHNNAYHDEEEADTISDERGNIADVLPQTVVANLSSKHKQGTKHSQEGEDHKHTLSTSPEARRKLSLGHSHHRQSSSHGRYSSFPETSGHPQAFRSEIIHRGSEINARSSTLAESDEDPDTEDNNESQPLLKDDAIKYGSNHDHKKHDKDVSHDKHKHRGPKDAKKGGGHSHDDLNMRGVFLHVLGDALGNIGVIATALFIWLTDFSWRYYADPAISLMITVIILWTALPLCRSASRILLQAVPAGLSIDNIKEDIQSLDGVISCHNIHVWQLSDTKLVASLHVMLAYDFEGVGKEEYMKLSREIRTCLREYGIRNPTVQAEFCLDQSHTHEADGTTTPKGSTRNGIGGQGDAVACVWDSGERGETCCPSETREEDED